MGGDLEVKFKAGLASIIESLERAEARFELASLEPLSKNDKSKDRALAEIRKALAAARVAAAAFGDVPKPIRH